MGYYLLIKEAVGIGVKYLCKCGDYKDPYEYNGSGVFWRKIINKHKPVIETTILGYYETNKALKEAGEYYSNKFDIVNDCSWANLIPEIGDGGDTLSGKIRCYNSDPYQEKFFFEDEVPEGWIRGCIRKKKERDGVERTSAWHRGRKRSEETRRKMRESTRKERMRIPCTKCQRMITPQNIVRHEEYCYR